MENKIESVAKAIEIITNPSNFEDIAIKGDSKFPFGLWFRGQSNSEWDLDPHVFRRKDGNKEITYDESSMFTQFQLRLPEYQQQYKSNFDWLCFMQHYKLPTRLLDWSENILVALFFAVNDNNNTAEKDGILYALNAKRLNKISIISEIGQESLVTPNALDALLRSSMAKYYYLDSILKDDRILLHKVDEYKLVKLRKEANKKDSRYFKKICYPVAVFPNRLNHRMIQQYSMITLHGGKLYTNIPKDIPPPIKLEKLNTNMDKNNKFLKYFLIPQNAKSKIKKELFYLSIHEGTLFPDLDYQSAFLKQQWTTYHDLNKDKFYINE